jgi:hypothetical protein
MISQLDLWPLVPWLLLSWLGACFLAVAGLATDAYYSRLPALPILWGIWECARAGIVFTISIIGYEAYSQKLISLGTFVLAVVTTILVVVGIEWLSGQIKFRRRPP